MGRTLNLTFEQIKKARMEIEEYCASYEAQCSKSVSYYMLEAYAYHQKKEEWIALLENKVHRGIISEMLKERRKTTKLPYGITDKDVAIYASTEAKEAYFAEKEKKFFDEIENAVESL